MGHLMVILSNDYELPQISDILQIDTYMTDFFH